NLGDYYTAGFSNARTGVNAHMGDFRPPLKLVRTIPLSGIKYPGVLMAFDDFLLVGAESYDEGELNDAGRYQLLDRQSGEVRWEQTLPGRGIGNWLPDYEPAYADDIVFLAGPATTAAKAVRVSTGEILWSDDTISDRSGRSPLISDGVVVYSGADRVVAAELETGEVLWQIDVETAPAPLCSIGDLVFWLDRERVVHAVRLRTGEEQWRSGPAPGTPFPFDVANLVASDSYLFVNMYRSGLSSGAGSVVQALDRKDGHVVWSLERPYEYVSKLLLAYDRLYVMEEEMGLVSTSHLAAYDPDVGSLLWKIDLSTHGGPNGMAPIPSLWGSGIGNEVLYYLDYARGSILARNALTGTVLGRWGSNDGVTADLCLADGQLLILGARTLEIYEPSHGIFFAHIADGGGQTTLLTLTNISSAPTTGSVHFLNDEGEPLSVVIEGQEASMSTVPFSIPARSSIAIQTTGGSEVQSGWARAEADQPIRGSSIFQYSGIRQGEHGRGDRGAGRRRSLGDDPTAPGSGRPGAGVAKYLDFLWKPPGSIHRGALPRRSGGLIPGNPRDRVAIPGRRHRPPHEERHPALQLPGRTDGSVKDAQGDVGAEEEHSREPTATGELKYAKEPVVGCRCTCSWRFGRAHSRRRSIE
ncbi:MAG: PQQ-binding-like beta-propeller repeat protein, partial [Acidobacteriota bacterium]